ncbi:uncharacterized protein LOC142570598 [Dermacentor variabilis]|uniref:uncharacterized protein LOC142570598 n=1 Tax=Dermacentor variabilis TaxID=34621 RepID=UPI003F5CA31F
MLTLDKCVRKKDTKDLLLRFGSCLWLSCTYFFTSAKHKRAKNVSTRIMLATWSFSVFIVVVLLSSRLVSTMLVKSTEDHVDALEDVLRFPKLKILAERGTAFDDFLMKPKTAFFKQIQRQVELVAGIIVPAPQQDAFFDRVERGSHVVLHEQNFQDAILARRFAERGRCRFRRAGQSLRLQPLAMILWNGLKPQVKKTITTM